MSYVLRLSTYIFLDFIMFLRYPVVNDHIPEPSIQMKITNYLITAFGQTWAHYLQQLPKMMPQWGKVHIRNGGDCIHAAIAQCDNSKNHKASFVQVHYQFLIIYFYGQLEYVLYCRLPENCTPDNPEPATLLLALITTCDMRGCNATQEEVCFKELSSYSKIIDLRTICAVVGCLKVGDAWAIIDRSGPFAQTVFTDDSLTVTGTNTDLGH